MISQRETMRRIAALIGIEGNSGSLPELNEINGLDAEMGVA